MVFVLPSKLNFQILTVHSSEDDNVVAVNEKQLIALFILLVLSPNNAYDLTHSFPGGIKQQNQLAFISFTEKSNYNVVSPDYPFARMKYHQFTWDEQDILQN